jgi:exonuclease III
MFKLISLNINHTSNLGGLINIIKSQNPDIFLLQEIPLLSNELSSLVARYGYFANTSLGEGSRPGVGVIYRMGLGVQEVLPLHPGRLQLIKLSSGLNILNIYAPSGNCGREDRRRFFSETVLRNLQLRRNLPVLAGDFNSILLPIDTIDNFKFKFCPALKDLVSLFNYEDAFRLLYPNIIDFTFQRSACSPSRLDRIYLPTRWKPALLDVTHSVCFSDHKFLILQLDHPAADPVPRVQPPYWKLNISVLQDDDFLNLFSTEWNRLISKQPEYPSVAGWWELCAKPGFKSFLIRLSVVRARFRRDTKLYLFSILELATDEQDWAQVSAVKARISRLVSEETEGYRIRSRVNEHVEREKGSLYHVNREIKNGLTNNLHSLLVRDYQGNLIETNDRSRVEEEVMTFYSSLFNGHHRTIPGHMEPQDTGVPFIPDHSDLPVFLEGLGVLEEGERESLEQPITLKDLMEALDTCSSNRAPGLDGLPYEFYQRVKLIVGPTLVRVFVEELGSGSLVKSKRVGVTRLLNKVKNTPSVTDLRPITLLTTDYKILSKILVKRLNLVLPSILLSNQLCSVPPKNILFGATNFISSLEYVNAKNIPAFIVSFDIFKAYDKANIPFITAVMRAMGFGDIFISWIECFHNDISTRFILGELSRELQVLISVRQGDPLAMPLFLIGIEPLLRYISRVISGMSVGRVVQREEGYVDDISALSSNPRDLLILEEAFLRFERVSGTVLNRAHKSKIMGLGPWRGREVWPVLWLKSVPSLKIFGITFFPTVIETIQASWSSCVEGVEKCIMSWSSRLLPTLSQRSTILSTFALSKLWYLGQVLPLPREHLQRLERMVGRFLWLGRLERLPLDELCAPLKQGGLGLPNISAKCDALFLKHLCRILSTPGQTQDHLMYWVGLSLRDYFPNLRQGLNAESVPRYFSHCIALLKEACRSGNLSQETLSSVTTRGFYREFNSTPPPPKISVKFKLDWDLVWRRLGSPVLSSLGRDVMFVIIHDIYPNKDRLFRLNQHPTGNCPSCRGCGEDNLHLFTNCSRTRLCWVYLRALIEKITRVLVWDDLGLLMLSFPETQHENGLIFLISNFVLFTTQQLKEDEPLTIPNLKAHLKEKMELYREGNLPSLGEIPIS